MRKLHHQLVGAVGVLALTACADKSITAPAASPGSPLYVINPAASGPGTAGAPISYPLYAGGGGDGTGTLVGYVEVYTVSGNQISVTYDASAGYCFTETHLHVASSAAGIPQRNGNPTPGQFQYKDEFNGCVDEKQYIVNTNGGTVVIAAHSVVQGSGSGGTQAFVSGTGSLDAKVTARRDGNVSGFTAIAPAPSAVAAWQNPEPGGGQAYWNSQITSVNPFNADPTNGQWLVNNGASWVWETGSTAEERAANGAVVASTDGPDADALPDGPQYGAVIKLEASIVVGAATTGSLYITCDNGYRAFLNGAQVSSDAPDPAFATTFTTQLNQAFNIETSTNLSESNVHYDGWQSVEKYAGLTLNAGSNALVVYGVNESFRPGDFKNTVEGDKDRNPAGCIFGIEAAVPGNNMGSETAWGAPIGFGGSGSEAGNFDGANWATFFRYQVN